MSKWGSKHGFAGAVGKWTCQHCWWDGKCSLISSDTWIGPFSSCRWLPWGCSLDVQKRTGHPLRCLDHRLYLASRPPDVPNNVHMLHLLPHHAHTCITHTCCLAGANDSNSAGLGGVLFCGLTLVFSWLSHWTPPQPTASCSIYFWDPFICALNIHAAGKMDVRQDEVSSVFLKWSESGFFIQNIAAQWASICNHYLLCTALNNWTKNPLTSPLCCQ